MRLRVASPAGVKTNVTVLAGQTELGTTEGVLGQDTLWDFHNVHEGQEFSVRIDQVGQQAGRHAIAAQWEGGSNVTVPFDKTLTGLYKDWELQGLRGRLRKFGTLGGSTELRAETTAVSSSAMWIWGPVAGSARLFVKCFLPGIFQDTTYPEDKFLQGGLPLIGSAETAQKAEAGPCNKPGQGPGAYSTDCLMDLFTASGGDPINGGLVKTGLTTLNRWGSSDNIMEWLGGMYRQATTGKNAAGTPLAIAAINESSQAMFGFDVASPCETIVESDDGRMGFAPKPAPLDPGCLSYLWANTGNDRSRGNEDPMRSSLLQNTYTSIQDRYSGLLAGEAPNARRSQYPFQTCHASGTKSPQLPSGAPNWDAITSVQTMDVGAVQDYYNAIYKTANYTVGNGTDANTQAQQEALRQCYGVKKVPDATCAL